MPTRTHSWAAVEVKLGTDFAIWKSKAVPQSQPQEYMDLVEGAWMKVTDRGLATIYIGKLEWELAPPSGYAGYFEKQDDWLLVSHSGFRVALRSPHGSGVLQVFPRSGEILGLQSPALSPLSHLEDGVDMSGVISRFFTSGEVRTSALPTLRRTMSQKKRAEIIGKKFGAPFLKCVNGLQSASDISDVLDTILGFSAVYISNQQVLQQVPEESDLEDTYYYDIEGMQELRSFNSKRRNACTWVRKQVREAAMKCQVAAEASSEVAKLGAGMFQINRLEPTTRGTIPPQSKDASIIFQKGSGEEANNPKFVDSNSDSDTDEFQFRFDKNSSSGSMSRPSSKLKWNQKGSMSGPSKKLNWIQKLGSVSPSKKLSWIQKGSMSGPSSKLEDHLISQPSASQQDLNSDKHESDCRPDPNGFSLDNDLIKFDDSEAKIDDPAGALLRTPSSGSGWQTDVGIDASSVTSWEFVRDEQTNDVEEEEDDILGAGISDAESLNMMLRDRDPFGCNGCSHLADEFLSLHSLSSAASLSGSTGQDQNVDGNELRKSKVLERLASWSSSNSGWSCSTDRDHGLPSVSKKIQTLQLETLAEEPACDPETASACRSFVMRAAAAGDVLQWCSCKFNKSRSSIEMRFQVGSFMEDDIATLSTGISRASPLRIEIFLDSTDVRESLLQGNVRICTDQGAPKEGGAPPVIGLSCYIPHLVRQYLQQSIREQASNGYEFPGGELLTGLMQHVVAKLVYVKHSCCVCNHQRLPDMITSMVPKPCDQNLCQALHDLWLVVAPPMVLERSTIESWLRMCCFEVGVGSDEALMLQYMGESDASLAGFSSFLSYNEKLDKVVKWITYKVVAGSWLTLVKDNKKKSEQELQYRADLNTFPRRTAAAFDSFETSLQAWQARYREMQGGLAPRDPLPERKGPSRLSFFTSFKK